MEYVCNSYPESISDISCQNKNDLEFKGSPYDRERIQMKLSSFMTGFTCLEKNMHHWTHDLDMNLFLAQMYILNTEIHNVNYIELTPEMLGCHQLTNNNESNVQSSPKLYDVNGHILTIDIPTPLRNERIEAINLWMNYYSAQSSLHYDAYHNFLLICQGQKTVLLISPEYTSVLKPHSACHNSPNHSSLTASEMRSKQKEIPMFEVVLKAGDILFIPEGCWHFVSSSQCTMAINFWFTSPLKKLLQLSHMSAYNSKYDCCYYL